MTNEMLCYDCLTENTGVVPAVTMRKGTALCESCAREYAAAESELSDSLNQHLGGPSSGFSVGG